MSQPTAPTEIANLALDLLKQPPVVDIVNPTSNLAAVCKRWYDPTRRELLRSHPWKFATKRAIWTPNAIPPEFGYQYAYDLPPDYMRICTIGDDSVDDIRRRYEIENGQLMLNPSAPVDNSGTIHVRYVWNIETVQKFDSLFVILLATQMAIHMSTKFSIGSAAKQELKDDLRDLKLETKAVNGQDKPPKRVQYSKIMTKRRGLPGGIFASPYTVFE